MIPNELPSFEYSQNEPQKAQQIPIKFDQIPSQPLGSEPLQNKKVNLTPPESAAKSSLVAQRVFNVTLILIKDSKEVQPQGMQSPSPSIQSTSSRREIEKHLLTFKANEVIIRTPDQGPEGSICLSYKDELDVLHHAILKKNSLTGKWMDEDQSEGDYLEIFLKKNNLTVRSNLLGVDMTPSTRLQLISNSHADFQGLSRLKLQGGFIDLKRDKDLSYLSPFKVNSDSPSWKLDSIEILQFKNSTFIKYLDIHEYFPNVTQITFEGCNFQFREPNPRLMQSSLEDELKNLLSHLKKGDKPTLIFINCQIDSQPFRSANLTDFIANKQIEIQ